MLDKSIDPFILDKLNHIISSYTCFDNRIQNHRIFKKHLKQKKQYKSVKKNIKSPEVLAREVRSLMNKLNKANYDKILTKMSYFVREDNLSDVLKYIIDSLVTNAIYMDLIINVIFILDSQKIHIPSLVLSYVSTLQKEVNTYIETLRSHDDTNEDYDFFCSISKTKTELKNKIVFILKINERISNIEDAIVEFKNFLIQQIETNTIPVVVNDIIQIIFNSEIICKQKLRHICAMLPEKEHILSVRNSLLLNL